MPCMSESCRTFQTVQIKKTPLIPLSCYLRIYEDWIPELVIGAILVVSRRRLSISAVISAVNCAIGLVNLRQFARNPLSANLVPDAL